MKLFDPDSALGMATCRRAAPLVAVLMLAGGCSTTPMLPALRADEPPRFDFPEPTTTGALTIANLSVGEGARTGSQIGVVSGALWGLACGPLAVLCVPVAAALGAGAGAGAGGIVGIAGALTPEQSEQLRVRLAGARRSHDLAAELREQITRRARSHWDTPASPPKASVTVRLKDVALTSTRDEQIGLVLEVSVSAQRERAAPGSSAQEKLFICRPSPAGLAVWLDARSDYVDVTLSGCVAQIAAQVVAELARP